MVDCSPVTQRESKALLEKVLESNLSVLGQNSTEIWTALIKDACRRCSVSIVVAQVDGSLAGWSISIVNHKAYLVRLLLRNPKMLVKVLCTELRNKRMKNSKVAPPKQAMEETNESYRWSNSSQHQWGASDIKIARHIDITVLPHYRRKGVGLMLMAAQAQDLAEKGVGRIDAVIKSDNLASIKMHDQAGWHYVEEKQGFIHISFFTDTDIK